MKIEFKDVTETQKAQVIEDAKVIAKDSNSTLDEVITKGFNTLAHLFDDKASINASNIYFILGYFDSKANEAQESLNVNNFEI